MIEIDRFNKKTHCSRVRLDCVLLYNNGNYENKVYLKKYIKERYKYVKVCNSVYKLCIYKAKTTKITLKRIL